MQRNSALFFHWRSLWILPQRYLRWLNRICCWTLLLSNKKICVEKLWWLFMKNGEPLYFLAVMYQEEVMIILAHTVQSGGKCIIPKNHWHLTMKSQHVGILKMKLSLECSSDSSLVSEGRSCTVLWLGPRGNSSFHASQQKLHSLVVTHAKRDLGAWFRSQLCHWPWISQPILMSILPRLCQRPPMRISPGMLGKTQRQARTNIKPNHCYISGHSFHFELWKEK